MAPYFPAYPHGTDLTTVEQELAGALKWLEGATARLPDRLRMTLAAIGSGRSDGYRRYEDHLERLELGSPEGLGQRIMRRLVVLALDRSKREGP